MAPPKQCSDIQIIDIRGNGDISTLDDIRMKLYPQEGQERRLPTLLLYDDQGLKLFEDITYLEDYYLTNAELEVLITHANNLAKFVSAGSTVVELGSGYA